MNSDTSKRQAISPVVALSVFGLLALFLLLIPPVLLYLFTDLGLVVIGVVFILLSVSVSYSMYESYQRIRATFDVDYREENDLEE